MTDYAELHCHSAYSLLDGACLPEPLVDRALALGLRGLALTDHDDMGGVVRFAQHARDNDAEAKNLAAILGLELTLADDTHLTLLARTVEGYQNLSRMVTYARSREPRGTPRVERDVLAQHTDGVLCLSGCPRAKVPQLLQQGNRMGAIREAAWLRDIFGREHFAVEVHDHGLPEQAALAGQLIELAGELGSPWVVTNNVHYALPAERIIHDVLVCLRTHTTVETAGRRLRPNAEWHLKGAAAMMHRWRHDLTGVRTSLGLAEQCTFRLKQLVPQLPSVPVPPEFPDANAYLRHLTFQGAKTRWGTIEPAQRRQLEHELSLMIRKGLAGYFLIMWEIVQFARSVEILVQARGSAANSAVCYCLGITAVDPIRFQLMFERFLSEARDGYPDIDLDIAHTRREEVIQWVYDRYGRDHAAMVCNHICFRGRSAARNAARALGFTPDEAGRVAEQLGHFGRSGNGLDDERIQAAGFDPKAPRIRALRAAVEGLRNLPRHRSIHVGGFVLSTQPVGEIVPIEPAAMEKRTIIQWDKDDLDAAGLPKFDLLGLGMLSALAEGLQLVRARHDIDTRMYNLPHDEGVYDMIGQADTVGVFQIESRAQMNCLPRTQPRTLYELAIQVALIRPGPLQGDMVHPYIRRKRGEETVTLFHPDVGPILDRTLGVPLFQEQAMQLAVAVADFSPVEADSLRRAMGSQRHRHKLEDMLDRLRNGMRRKGVEEDYIERVVQQIHGFSNFGFPESHSTSFALIVYASCWLKHRHPAEFLCSLLNAQPLGFYSPAALIFDARRHGVEVRPPCLRHSEWRTLMEGDAVRLGLRLVKGLGAASKKKLHDAREQGRFINAEDMVERTDLPRRALITLAEAGCFDAFIQPRRQAIWQVLRLAKNTQYSLPLGLGFEDEIEFPRQSPLEQTSADYRTMRLTTGQHPVCYLREKLDRWGALRACDLLDQEDKTWVRVGGQVNTRQRPESAKGFFFVTLEDETGFINVIVRPQLFEPNRRVLVGAPFMLIEGELSLEQGVANVQGKRFEELLFDVDVGKARSFR